MPSGDFPEVVAAQILFWILLPIVVFAPLRWAVSGLVDHGEPGHHRARPVGLHCIRMD